MTIVNIHETKTHLSRLLVEVQAGKEILIGKNGIPVAKLVPCTMPIKKRKGGQLKGKMVLSADFDVLPKTFTKHFSP